MAIQTPTENWFKFPNHIADNLTDYTPFELKILVLMLRRTVGMLGLTKTPDQRFSQSFIVKNTGISDSQVYRAKKSLIAKGAIKEDGTAADGSKLYSVVWDIPVDTPLCPPEASPSSHQSKPPLSGRATDKDIVLKKEEEKTLDASASSAAPEKVKASKQNPPFYQCAKCYHKITEISDEDHRYARAVSCPKCSDDKIKFRMLLVREDLKPTIFEITHLPEKTQINHDVKLSGSKEAIEQLKAALPNTIDDIKSLIIEQATSKEDKIPKATLDRIGDSFKALHKQIRNRDPIYNYGRQAKAIKELFGWLGTEEVIYEFRDALFAFAKSSKNDVAKTIAILPSSLSDKMLNHLTPYLKKTALPKLEIKQYENKGIAIGPMPEGW